MRRYDGVGFPMSEHQQYGEGPHYDVPSSEQEQPMETDDVSRFAYNTIEKRINEGISALAKVEDQIERRKSELHTCINDYAVMLGKVFGHYRAIVPQAKEHDWNIFKSLEIIKGQSWSCDLNGQDAQGEGAQFRYYNDIDEEDEIVAFDSMGAERAFENMCDRVRSYARINTEDIPKVIDNWQTHIQTWYKAIQQHENQELEEKEGELKNLNETLAAISKLKAEE